MRIHEQDFSRKLFSLIGVSCAFFLILLFRLFYLQINLNRNLLAQSHKNFLRYEPINSLRGTIIDSKGKLLATNRPVINIYWKGSGNRVFSVQQKKEFTQLKTILETVLADETSLLQAERKAQKLLLSKDVPFETLSKITEQLGSASSIVIETDYTRFYPYKNLASHALGYLGNLDIGWSGKMGLEKLYETTLRGKSGMTQKVLNSFGKNLSEKEVEQAFAGQDITITLDLSLQRIAEMLFPQEKKGIIFVMDSTDGSIRVALSRPDFDPNIFLESLDHETWNTLKERKPFLNRIYQACYPPGSIFKLITLAAGLEKNIIHEDEEWECKGFVQIGNRKFRCHKRDGHGYLNPTEVIAKSCNTLFYEIGKRLDIDDLAEFAYKFGLGKKTGSVFNDKIGLVPTRDWKTHTKGERWWLGETVAATIGQTYLLTTPAQIARMMAAIEVGYLVTPRILEESTVTYEPLSIAYSTRTFLKEAMHAVTEEGTARTLKKLGDDFEVYAKTSTAQTSAWEKRKLGEEYLEHGWFTANFKYKDEPPMTMVVLVENAGNARLSLMIAKAFLKSYRDLIELRKKRAKKK
jgi:penicillin-binding protein 2